MRGRGIALDHLPDRPAGGRQRPAAGQRVQRHRAILGDIEARRGPGPGLGHGEVFTSHPCGLVCAGQTPEPVDQLLRHPGRARQLACLGRRGARRNRKPFEHRREQTRQRQVRPFGIGADVEQHDLALTETRPGDQRRAIGERGDRAFGQFRRGFGHDLRVDRDIGRHSKAREGRAFGEGRQSTRLAPAHRAADRPPARAQPHRQEHVSLFAGRGHPRPGEAHEQPALFEPVGKAVGFGDLGHIGQHDDIGLRGQNIRQRALDQIGGGRERAVEVVGRAEQFEPLARRATGDQRDLAAARGVVGQADGAGRAQADDLEPADAVAQLRRQIEAQLGRAGLGGFAGQFTLDPGRVGADGSDVERNAERGRGEERHDDRTLVDLGGTKCRDRPAALPDGQRSAGGQRRSEVCAPLARKPVRNPERVEIPLGQGRLRGRGFPRLRRKTGQSRGQLGRRSEARRHRWRIGQRDQSGGAASGGRLAQRAVDTGAVAGPVTGRGPAAILDDQQWSTGGAGRDRVQNGAGKPKDRGGQRGHPQEQQPPRRALGLHLFVGKAEKQCHPRKPAPDRRGRNGAQQEPQDRQRHEAQQKPGRGKAQGTDQRHRAPRSSAAQSHRSAPCAGSPV